MRLMQETVDWVKSVERPGKDGGWAYQYLPDGSEVFSVDYKVYRYDKPETWPNPLPPKSGSPKYSRDNGGAGDAEGYLACFRKGGREALRASFTGPVTLSPEEYLRARIAAAKWPTDERRLQTVRQHPLRQCSPEMEPDREENAKRGGDVQWQYLMKVRIAQGRFTPEHLAPGAPPHLAGQGPHAFKAVNWLDIPWNRQ